MSDLNKIQSAQTIIVTDGLTQEAVLGSSIPVGTEVALLVRDACVGQQTAANSRPVVIASDQSAITVAQATAANLNAQVQGNVASGAADSGKPVKIGAVGHTAQPTAVTDGQRVDTVADKVGRLVITNMQVRDLKTNNRTSISSTTETTVLAAVASTFLDITQIIITNTSTTKDANVDFRDSTGGTIRVTIHAPALATTVVNFADILTQATVNNNWTAQSDSATATLAITVLAIKNI